MSTGELHALGQPDPRWPSREAEEDYAVRRVPLHWRRRWGSLVSVSLGIGTAMAFMQVGAVLALTFGTLNAAIAELYATLMAGAIGLVMARKAGTTGLGSYLLSRGAGYGFAGAAVTSFIYSLNYIALAAIEGAIMSGALHSYFPAVPIQVFYLVSGAVLLPLGWRGVTRLAKVESYTVPVYFLLVFLALVLAATGHETKIAAWWTYLPAQAKVGGAALVAAVGIVNGLTGITGIFVAEYARLARPSEVRGFSGLLLGTAPALAGFLFSGFVGIFLGVHTLQANPGVFMVALLGTLGVLFVVLTQLRINVLNVYFASLTLATFFARVLRFAPGRNFWSVVAVAIAVALMFLSVLQQIGPLLTFLGVFQFAWASSLLVDLLFVHPRLLGTAEVEHRRAMLPEWNWTGVIALGVGSGVGAALAFGALGPLWSSLSAFVAGALAALLHGGLAYVTRARGYRRSTRAHPKPNAEQFVARPEWERKISWASGHAESTYLCGVCRGLFVIEDMVHCPHEKKALCSSCCGTNSQCGALCQRELEAVASSLR